MTRLTHVGLFAGLLATRLSAQFCAFPPDALAFAPDASMTAGKTPGGNYFDHRSSAGTAYSQDCQPYFMVDVTLPGAYSVPGVGNAISIGGGFANLNQLTEQSCPFATESVAIYKRAAAPGFAGPWILVKSQYAVGHWLPSPDIGLNPFCALSTSLRVTASGNPGMDQYRVMVLPKLYGAVVPARVAWTWTY